MVSIFNFLYSFEIVLYELQQRVTFLLTETTDSLSFITCLLFILSGTLTILNPCLISLFPLSISYFNTYKKPSEKNIFVLGLITSTFFSVFVTNFFSYNSFIYIIRFPIFSLIIAIFLSLNLLQILNVFYYLNISSFFKRLSLVHNDGSTDFFYQSYLTGFIIGFTIIPCNTPILAMVHFWLYNCSSIFVLFIYLFMYFLGCILPFLLIFYFFMHYLNMYFLASISGKISPFLGFTTLTISLFFLLEKVFL